jgi:hypothetical protein
LNRKRNFQASTKNSKSQITNNKWFDRPFDRLTVLSNVEGLTTLSNVEGQITTTKIKMPNLFELASIEIWRVEFENSQYPSIPVGDELLQFCGL